ncbi:MAG: VOC family protein [Desulfobacteraceae bacterium]|nr:VOC family protein [Desulfobacteraceae bacterium]
MSWSYDHVHLKASDLNETVDFYHKNFNAEQKFSREFKGMTIIGMDINGMTLLISGAIEGENPKPGSADPQFGIIHFGLRCDNLEQKIAELKNNGVEFTMDLTDIDGSTKIAFIKAPDEVLIELLQRG